MIFNKNNTGAIELKALLGFIYKSNRFENLITYLDFAKKEVTRIIGNEIYDLAEKHYNSENYNAISDPLHPEYPLLDELVKRVQLPVGLYAYLKFIPSGDLTHSDKGRQIFVSETEKPAFEWQVVRDNQNILSLAFEAIDLLLEYIDSQADKIVFTPVGDQPVLDMDMDNPIALAWFQSDAYLKIQSAMITMEEFNSIFPINSSMRLFIALVPFIFKVQQQSVIPVITDSKYIELDRKSVRVVKVCR